MHKTPERKKQKEQLKLLQQTEQTKLFDFSLSQENSLLNLSFSGSIEDFVIAKQESDFESVSSDYEQAEEVTKIQFGKFKMGEFDAQSLFSFVEEVDSGNFKDDKLQCRFCKKRFLTGCALGGHISKKHNGIISQIKKKNKSQVSHPTEQKRNKYLRSLKKKIRKNQIIFNQKNSVLHIGQELLISSHGNKQYSWKKCQQGKNITISFQKNESVQIVQLLIQLSTFMQKSQQRLSMNDYFAGLLLLHSYSTILMS